MAPISSRMRERYDSAVQSVSDFIEGELRLDEVPSESFSELKGMFNRCVRQDQWDWFTVYSELERPSIPRIRRIAEELTVLRRACLEVSDQSITVSIERLSQLGLRELLRSYQRKPQVTHSSNKSGWLYVLSTREQPALLKIGMTRRSVEERVKEINSATGVPIPFSARSVFSVNDARDAERRVFENLDSFRIRSDREFFQVPYEKAIRAIKECLSEFGLLKRPNGSLAWLDHERGYGFIDYDGGQTVFLHFSEVEVGKVNHLMKGTNLEFDLGFGKEGMFARKAKVLAAAGNEQVDILG